MPDQIIIGTSTAAGTPAVQGINTATASGAANGVFGKSDQGEGVHAETNSPIFAAIAALVTNPLGTGAGIYAEGKKGAGVWAKSETNEGLHGETNSLTMAGVAAIVVNVNGTGAGVYAEGKKGAGVWAQSAENEALHGETHSKTQAAIAGLALNPDGTGAGVYGNSIHGEGITGSSRDAVGVHGLSQNHFGLMGESEKLDGIFGITKGEGKAGVIGISANGNGIYAEGRMAGWFKGDVHVTGNITSDGDIFLTNADFAEDFDVAGDGCEAGTVMILSRNGGLEASSHAYDKKVAGIISGAGTYKPGIVLDRHADQAGRQPLAMVGKVFCKVDADIAPIEIGDLLTTSDMPGHAMKAVDSAQAFGTVLGKALQSKENGKGLIAVLVSLQ